MVPEWAEIIVSILSGLAVAIPMAVKLVEYVQKATKEKNWNKMVELVINLMEEAETKLEQGADRKEWVLAMVKASADTINYDVDLAVIGNMIDHLCDMSKIVNGSETVKKEEETKTPASQDAKSA